MLQNFTAPNTEKRLENNLQISQRNREANRQHFDQEKTPEIQQRCWSQGHEPHGQRLQMCHGYIRDQYTRKDSSPWNKQRQARNNKAEQPKTNGQKVGEEESTFEISTARDQRKRPKRNRWYATETDLKQWRKMKRNHWDAIKNPKQRRQMKSEAGRRNQKTAEACWQTRWQENSTSKNVPWTSHVMRDELLDNVLEIKAVRPKERRGCGSFWRRCVKRARKWKWNSSSKKDTWSWWWTLKERCGD